MAIAPVLKKCSKQGSTGMITLVDVKTDDHGGSGGRISGRLDRRGPNGCFRRYTPLARQT
jgi:hypothetical protein